MSSLPGSVDVPGRLTGAASIRPGVCVVAGDRQPEIQNDHVWGGRPGFADRDLILVRLTRGDEAVLATDPGETGEPLTSAAVR